MLGLLALHHELDKLLASHQACLVQGTVADAIVVWNQFREALTEHADDEEQRLFPLYQERVTIPAGGSIELFNAEHNKIRAFLSEISGRLQDLTPVIRPEAHLIVAIIEREYELKRLLEHHDMREANFLYPLLDRCTTPEEREKLLSQIRRAI
jgi:iron-sulfur cluster repair protein YtfE (RIC family)